MCSSVLHDQFEQTNFQVVHVKVRSLVKVACVELHIVPFIMVLFYFTVQLFNSEISVLLLIRGHQTVLMSPNQKQN